MRRSKLTAVIDTNVLIVSVLPQFRFHWIYEALLKDRYEMPVSTEILAEYEEQLGFRYGLKATERQLDFLLMLTNVRLTDPFYRWELMTNDPDDNKFVDCAIASNADFIVTEDRHFQILMDVPFPRVNVIGIEEFKKVLGV